MRYVTIVGGGLGNKGAQSMTFVTVNEIKNRFPDKEVVLFLGGDHKRCQQEISQYAFRIMGPIGLKTAFFIKYGVYRLITIINNSNKNKLKEIENILKNTDIMIDISGYMLGSNRGILRVINYILRIKVAKYFGINMFLMPQSFGPLDYKGIKGLFINLFIKKYLKYPKVIYAREREGYDLLTNKYKLRNVSLSNDLVLLNQEIDINNIYNNIPNIKTIEMISNIDNVAIIPNMKNFIYGNKEKIIFLYEKIIDKLISSGKSVYLIKHAEEDIEVCKIIKSKFIDNTEVILVPDEFSCIEYDQLVNRFDFLIASRYHSIIHAYKNGIPCIALGWATKYHELLSTFKQHKYIFDVRRDINMEAVLQAINIMQENYKTESEKIKNILIEIQNNNVFDILEGKS